MLSDRIGEDLFVRAVAALLKAPVKGMRDTRRQRVARSVGMLAKVGDLRIVAGAVLLA